MPGTRLADVIVPEIFMPYVKEETINRNLFLRSGIAAPVEGVDISRGGVKVNIPMWKRPVADDEILKEGTPLTVNKITATKDVALIHARSGAFSSTDVAHLLAGDDPMKAIGNFMSDWWADRLSVILCASLKGAMGSAGMADSVLDKSTTELDAKLMTQASFLLGDNFSKIKAVAFSSKVLAKLKQLDIVDWVQPSELEMGYYTYMEKRVIVDDCLAPESDGVYPIYFFGNGAVVFNENDTLQEIEFDRDILLKEDVVSSTRVFTMHPRGIRFKGEPAGDFATNEELANPANWERVAERKNIAITKLLAKISD
ncbi:MAG: hypothetical protein KBT03_05845 [Bacteroidales bacterium]|nr:hypothetical protein [Candidatus Scybalousia scybalohippi]